MEHHAHAHARPHIGRASRQVAERFVEGIGYLLFDQIVDAGYLLPGPFEVQAAVHYLDTEVVLFVDHQAVSLMSVDGHRASSGAFGMLAADQMPFDQELAVKFGQRFHVYVEQLLAFLQIGNAIVQSVFDMIAIGFRSATNKGIVGQIAGKPYAAADYNIRFGSRTSQPFTRFQFEVVNFQCNSLILIIEPIKY